MKLKEAIEELKLLSEQIALSPIKEAIETVVEHCEQKTYTAEDMVNFASWVRDGFSGKRIGIKWNGEFVQFIECIPVTLSNEQVVKIWEEQR